MKKTRSKKSHDSVPLMWGSPAPSHRHSWCGRPCKQCRSCPRPAESPYCTLSDCPRTETRDHVVDNTECTLYFQTMSVLA
jgi:hypothetical protein